MNNGTKSAEKFEDAEHVDKPLEFIVDNNSPISRIALTEDFGGVKIEYGDGEVFGYHFGQESLRDIELDHSNGGLSYDPRKHRELLEGLVQLLHGNRGRIKYAEVGLWQGAAPDYEGHHYVRVSIDSPEGNNGVGKCPYINFKVLANHRPTETIITPSRNIEQTTFVKSFSPYNS